MRWTFGLLVGLAVAGCAAPPVPAPAPAPPASTPAPIPIPIPAPVHAERPELNPPRASWAMELDRRGITADGVRIDVTDAKGIQQALYKHWKEERFVNVAPDTPALSIRRMIDGVWLAKLSTIALKKGSFTQDLWASFIDSEPNTLVLAAHLVDGDVARLRRFVIASDLLVPVPAEELDWKLHEEASSATARAWLAAPGRHYEMVSLVTLAELPFGELATALTKLRAIWPAASPLRLWLQEPARVALNAALVRRLNAETLPPSVIYSNLKLVDVRLTDCYLAHTHASSPLMRIIFDMHIAAAGTTTVSVEPETTITDPEMLRCMISNMNAIRFPERKGADMVQTKQAFHFYREQE